MIRLIRRASLIFLLFLLLPGAGYSQQFEPFRNSFVSAGLGGNFYKGNIGAETGLAFGKWLLNTTALRGHFQVCLLSGNGSSMHAVYYGTADLLVDLYSAIRGRNPSDWFRSYMLLGGGVVHSSTGDNDFCASVGIGGEFRISDDWRLFAEFGALIHPSDFDNNKTSSLKTSFDVGVVFDIADNPTRSRSRFETKTFDDDWSFDLAMGVCAVNYSEVSSFDQRLSLLTPIFEFGIAKRLTTFWQIRLCASGLYAKTIDELFSYYNMRGDILIDPVAYLNPSTANPIFSIKPYLGVGVVARLDNQSNFLVAPAAGMQLVWRADSRNQLYLDGRYVVTPPRFVNTTVNQRMGSVGLFTLLLGYSHTFSRISLR